MKERGYRIRMFLAALLGTFGGMLPAAGCAGGCGACFGCAGLGGVMTVLAALATARRKSQGEGGRIEKTVLPG